MVATVNQLECNERGEIEEHGSVTIHLSKKLITNKGETYYLPPPPFSVFYLCGSGTFISFLTEVFFMSQ
jgi:hypothetical protein